MPVKVTGNIKVYVIEHGAWGVSEVLASSGIEVKSSSTEPIREMELKAALTYPRLLGSRLEAIVKEAASIFLENVETPLKKLYPGDDVDGYIWVRFVRCPGGSEAPIISDPIVWEERKLALKYDGDRFELVHVTSLDDARKRLATVKGKVIRCPDGSVVTVDDARRMYKRILDSWAEGKWGFHPLRLVAVKTLQGFEDAEGYERVLEEALEVLGREWPLLASEGLLPSEPLPHSPLNYYGVNVAYKMFTARQILAHAEAIRALRRVKEEIEASHGSLAGEAAVTYIVLAYLDALGASTAFTPWDHKRGVPSRLKIGLRGLLSPPRLHGEAHLPSMVKSVAREAVKLARVHAVNSGNPIDTTSTSFTVIHVRVNNLPHGAVPYSSWALRALSSGTPPIEYQPSLEVLVDIASHSRAMGFERLIVAVEGGPRRLLYIVDELLSRGWAPRVVGLQSKLWNVVLEAVKAYSTSCTESPTILSKLSIEASKRARLKVKQGYSVASASVASMVEAIGVVGSECWPIISYMGSKLSTGHLAARIISEAIVSALSEALALNVPLADSYTLLYLALLSEGPVSREAYTFLSKILGVDPELGFRCCFVEKSGFVRPLPLSKITPPKKSLLRRLKGNIGYWECFIAEALERLGENPIRHPLCSIPLQGALMVKSGLGG